MLSKTTIRAAALALSLTLVTGAIAALGSYSNAKFASAATAAERPAVSPAVEVEIAPSRIEVVAVRAVRSARAASKAPNS